MRKSLFILLAGLVLFVPVITQAIDVVTSPIGCQDIDCLISSIIDFIFKIAIIIAPIMLIIAGFFFVTSMGEPAKIQKAKDVVLWTLIGLAIVVMARGIVAVFNEIFEL